MAYSESQITALETSISLGALSVQYNDRRVTYHSLDEMLRLLALMRSELGIATPANARGRFIHIPTGKGL